MNIDIDLVSSEFKAKQYPAFTLLRAEDPIHKVTLTGNREAWLITRYEDAEAILRDQRFVKDINNALPPEQIAKLYSWLVRPEAVDPADADPSMNHHMLNTDPPDHTRLRALVNIAFTPRLVEQWRERIQAITDMLIDKVESQGSMELVGDFAFPLPIMVITEMLGIPAEGHAQFRIWSNIVMETAGNPAGVLEAHDKIQAFRKYLLELFQEKRIHPSDDLLSKLVHTDLDGDHLSEHELVGLVFLLIVAGHETTVSLISNSVLALLQHPDQKELLQLDPSLIKTAIEEFLRYYSPIAITTQRWAKEDLELNGTHIARGDYVLISLSSANRDTTIFTHGDELDITRQDNHHLAFGKGIHYCLGAPLARMEGQIAISTLLRRLPTIELATDQETLVWRPGALILGLRELPVKF